MRPIIKREIAKAMKDFIQPFLDLIRTLVQPQQGTKFLITLAGIGGIIFLQMKGIGSGPAIITIGVLVASYYIADIFAKGKKNGGE